MEATEMATSTPVTTLPTQSTNKHTCTKCACIHV